MRPTALAISECGEGNTETTKLVRHRVLLNAYSGQDFKESKQGSASQCPLRTPSVPRGDRVQLPAPTAPRDRHLSKNCKGTSRPVFTIFGKAESEKMEGQCFAMRQDAAYRAHLGSGYGLFDGCGETVVDSDVLIGFFHSRPVTRELIAALCEFLRRVQRLRAVGHDFRQVAQGLSLFFRGPGRWK